MATLDELINRMYDMVQDAKGIPLAGEKCILERDQMLDLLDELRSTLPNAYRISPGLLPFSRKKKPGFRIIDF